MSKFGQIRFNNGVEDKTKREETVVIPEYTNVAFSLIKHPNNNGYALVTVSFNPVTGEAKVTSMEKHENRQDCEYYFKVKVGEYFADQESRS